MSPRVGRDRPRMQRKSKLRDGEAIERTRGDAPKPGICGICEQKILHGDDVHLEERPSGKHLTKAVWVMHLKCWENRLR